MTPKREFPDHPLVGVGGVVISGGRTLLVRRGHPPLAGEWSIPGGMLELGETLEQGVKRELLEETGLVVDVLGLIGAFDRIDPGSSSDANLQSGPARPQYHFVILDYLCKLREGYNSAGSERAGSDAAGLAWVFEQDLLNFGLTRLATDVLKRAFTMSRDLKL